MIVLDARQRRTIDRLKEKLVPAAEKLLDDAQVKEISRKKFGESQLRNLLAIAKKTESPAVVSNFIRYQMGRDTKKLAWAKKPEGQDKALGDRLIDELETGVVATALGKIDGVDEEQKQLAKIELIRHFLGFASRYLRYLDPQRPGGNGDEEDDRE
jgi:hypothetical protein